jgi:hypothetical protein
VPYLIAFKRCFLVNGAAQPDFVFMSVSYT